jgi:Mg2+ and Co2+ transporter CorA
MYSYRRTPPQHTASGRKDEIDRIWDAIHTFEDETTANLKRLRSEAMRLGKYLRRQKAIEEMRANSDYGSDEAKENALSNAQGVGDAAEFMKHVAEHTEKLAELIKKYRWLP